MLCHCICPQRFASLLIITLLTACSSDRPHAHSDASARDLLNTDHRIADARGSDFLGDTAPADQTIDAPGHYEYTCQPVGNSDTDGFFSLAAFDGKLYAGQFGYNHTDQSMLYRYPPWELTQPGLTGIGESVCAMKAFDGFLFANTENSGDIFRSADGLSWTKVYNGSGGSIGCGLADLDGKLYAVNYDNTTNQHGKVLSRNGGAWSTVYDSGARSLYLREIVSYAGKLYAFGVEGTQAKMVTSSDGTAWTEHNVDQRFFRGHTYGGYLWLGSSNSYFDGQVAIWRYDGTSFTSVHSEPAMSHIADVIDYDGQLFASTASGFKEGTGPSKLLMSPDGTSPWQTLCTLTEAAIWSLAVFDGVLYLGSWHFGKGGKVYKLVKTWVAD